MAWIVKGRDEDPSGVILDGRVMQSTPESRKRTGYDRHKRRKGSKIHIAIDTLGHLLAVKVTAANQQEPAQRNCARPSRRPLANECKWPTSIRATLEKPMRMRPLKKELNCGW
ncbi:MAG: hypothetical protein CL946_00500 [Ectothiorhodospiraceae bacterium]|nr:hypothetical protein [Ectothiorhodospiraceae bacterium]